MARPTYNRTSEYGQRIDQIARNGVACRRDAEELHRILEKDGDNAAIATKAGLADSNAAQALRDLLARLVGETADVVLTGQGITEGNQTNTRAFLDSYG